jgi:hypothetical protein
MLGPHAHCDGSAMQGSLHVSGSFGSAHGGGGSWHVGSVDGSHIGGLQPFGSVAGSQPGGGMHPFGSVAGSQFGGGGGLQPFGSVAGSQPGGGMQPFGSVAGSQFGGGGGLQPFGSVAGSQSGGGGGGLHVVGSAGSQPGGGGGGPLPTPPMSHGSCGWHTLNVTAALLGPTGSTAPADVITSSRYCLPAGNDSVNEPSLRTRLAVTTSLSATARTATALFDVTLPVTTWVDGDPVHAASRQTQSIFFMLASARSAPTLRRIFNCL